MKYKYKFQRISSLATIGIRQFNNKIIHKMLNVLLTTRKNMRDGKSRNMSIWNEVQNGRKGMEGIIITKNFHEVIIVI